MKVSVLTATYNRAELLKSLYDSILKNIKFGLDIEWLIMDDGSTDGTKEVVENFQSELVKQMSMKNSENNLEIKYFCQENQGKMVAINNKMNETAIISCIPL